MLPEDDDLQNEGHTREWQNRARVMLDAKEAAKTEASPKQSPLPGDDVEDLAAKGNQSGQNEKDPAY